MYILRDHITNSSSMHMSSAVACASRVKKKSCISQEDSMDHRQKVYLKTSPFIMLTLLSPSKYALEACTTSDLTLIPNLILKCFLKIFLKSLDTDTLKQNQSDQNLKKKRGPNSAAPALQLQIPTQ